MVNKNHGKQGSAVKSKCYTPQLYSYWVSSFFYFKRFVCREYLEFLAKKNHSDNKHQSKYTDTNENNYRTEAVNGVNIGTY